MIILKCDRCGKELSGLDDANLMKYKNLSAHAISSLCCTNTQLLDGGDICILCEKCMEDFNIFLKNTNNYFKE